jgi:hypothetical protein
MPCPDLARRAWPMFSQRLSRQTLAVNLPHRLMFVMPDSLTHRYNH